MMQGPSTVLKNETYYPADEAQLVFSGPDYFDKLIALIRAAKYILHFQMYIYDEDDTGILIAKELKLAARAGVKIYLVLDAFGSKDVSKHFIRDLSNAGIYVHFFAPFFSKNTINLGRRMHHKIIVADGIAALIGGINISDKYRGTATKVPWLDYAVLVKGNVCERVNLICDNILEKRFPLLTKRSEPSVLIKEACMVRFRQNDYFRRKRQISKSYLQAIKSAESSIIFISSYFLPGLRILKALKNATERGVQISIILSSNSDILLFEKATNHLYSALMKSGIHIYEWQHSILHGKLAMVDKKWVTVGSFNLNYLSALSSIELNVEILNQQLTDDLEKHIQEIIKTGCRKIDYDGYLKTNTWKKRFVNQTVYYLTRMLMKSLALFPNFFSGSQED